MQNNDIYNIYITVNKNGYATVKFNTIPFANVTVRDTFKVYYREWISKVFLLHKRQDNVYYHKNTILFTPYTPNQFKTYPIVVVDEKAFVFSCIRSIKNGFIGKINIYMELL